MKKTISKIFSGIALTAATAFVLISCQKEQHRDSEKSSQTANIGCDDAIPAILDVPAGNKLAYRVFATGVQIYQVKRSTENSNEFIWVNIAPRANLYIQQSYNNLVGTHYGGPSWEFIQGPYKGEKTVATKLQGVTVDPTAVPWLLLKSLEAQSSTGNKVSYIQRVCTTGGLAPAIIPNESNLGQVEEVTYTATYLFYEKKSGK